MPAVEAGPETTFLNLEHIANLLASGFESLLADVQNLSRREQNLKSRLEFAQNEVRKSFSTPASVCSMMRNQN